MHNHHPAFSPSAPSGAMRHATAIVKSVSAAGCEIDIGGVLRASAIATHIPGVVPGQRVAVLEGDADCLVVAAWPPGDGSAAPPLHFDAATGTLHIQSARLSLEALACIELRCGEAHVRITLDGKVHIEGNDIVSAAMCSNRIEGASIDLN